jgi:tetratricopeptide (TPR) repeat protein
MQRALALALEYELPAAALRAYNNISDLLHRRDRCEEAVELLEDGIAFARRVGDRVQEVRLLCELSWSLVATGRWQEALAILEQVDDVGAGTTTTLMVSFPEPLMAQGKVEIAQGLLSACARWADSVDVQERTMYEAGHAVVLMAEGKEREAIAAAQAGLAALTQLGPTSQATKVAAPVALDARLALGEREAAEELLDLVEALPPGRKAPMLRAHAERFRARLAAADGETERAEKAFATAVSTFREFGMPYWLAVTLLEHAEWLAAEGRAAAAEPKLAEAREIFERLEATRWLERMEQPSPREEVPA